MAMISARPAALDLRVVERAAAALQDDLVEGLQVDFPMHPRLAPAVVLGALEKAAARLITMELAGDFPGSLVIHQAWMREGLRSLLERTRHTDAEMLGITGNPGGE